MVVVRVFGGLGNQMFQYAFYQYLRRKNEDLYFDTSEYDIQKHHYGYELEKVFSNLDYCSADKKMLRKIRVNPNAFINRALRKTFGIELVKKGIVYEWPAAMHVNDFKYAEDVYFSGFWINLNYVKEVENKLRSQFTFRHEITGKNKELADRMKERESVAIHIRRGDYLASANLSKCCTEDYYKTAIKMIYDKISNPLFVVFSDDIEWARHNLNYMEDRIFVDWNKKDDSHMDMQMMSMCSHNIIANSTFSWWGAWLNDNKNKIVIGPQKWNVNEDIKNPIMEDNWISI